MRRMMLEQVISSAVTAGVTAAFKEQDKAAFGAHLEDCSGFRRDNNERLTKIEEAQRATSIKIDDIDKKLDKGAQEQTAQHTQNLGSLRWQRGILIGILLAIVGFAASHIFTTVYEPHATAAYEQSWPRR